jgi:putative membrane protein
MTHLIATVTALVMGASVLTGPAFSQAAGQSSPPGATTAASVNSSEDYVTKAAQGDLFEVQAGQLAGKQAQQEDVRKFADMMIKDHTKSSADIKAALQSGKIKVTPPSELDKEHQAKLEQLKTAASNQFDQAYMRQQVEAHQQALALHRTYSQKGDNPDLQATAQKISSVVEQHLKAAQDIHKSLPTGPGQGKEMQK